MSEPPGPDLDAPAASRLHDRGIRWSGWLPGYCPG